MIRHFHKSHIGEKCWYINNTEDYQVEFETMRKECFPKMKFRDLAKSQVEKSGINDNEMTKTEKKSTTSGRIPVRGRSRKILPDVRKKVQKNSETSSSDPKTLSSPELTTYLVTCQKCQRVLRFIRSNISYHVWAHLESIRHYKCLHCKINIKDVYGHLWRTHGLPVAAIRRGIDYEDYRCLYVNEYRAVFAECFPEKNEEEFLKKYSVEKLIERQKIVKH